MTAARHRLEFSPAAARQLRKLDRAAADGDLEVINKALSYAVMRT